MRGWSKKRLAEITEKIGSGATPRGGQDAYKESGISLFRSLNVYDGVFKKKNLAFIDEDQASKLSNVVVREGDVLLNITGASIARCCVAPSELLPARVNQHVSIIRPKADYVDSHFLAYLLASKQYKDALLHTGEKAGSTRQALTKAQLENFEVTIPKLPEQKRVVAIVDEAFEGIDRAIANTEKNLTNARELFESYLNSVLSGKGKQWKETTLGKEIDLLTGFAFKSSGYTDSDKSIRLLRGDNIIPGSLRWEGVKKWPESEVNEYLPYQLQEGDVVLAMDRPWIKAGLRRAQISKDDLPCLLVQRTACLRGGDNLENRFLLYLISGRSFTQHVLGSQTGLSVPHISGKQIQDFKFNKPPLKDQYSILDSLDELRLETQRLEAIYQRKLAALNELKQSILQKAFTGELTADTTNQATKAAKEVVAA